MATSQCINKKTNDTGANNRQPRPQRRLVLNAAIRVPMPPKIIKAIPIYASALNFSSSNVGVHRLPKAVRCNDGLAINR